MDHFVNAVRINSQDVVSTQTDWRQDVDQLEIEPFELPSAVSEALRDFMQTLGLRFGAIDMIVTPNGDYVFLEVNEMGQFLWIDQMAPQSQLLAHFCAFLCCAERPYLGDLGRFEHLRLADYRSGVTSP